MLADLSFLEIPALDLLTPASTIRTAYAHNHIFNKVFVFWGINDGHIILTGLKLPQGRYQRWYHVHAELLFYPRPRHTWRSLFSSRWPPSQISWYSLVVATTFVDQMASCGGLATVDMPMTMMLIWVFSFPLCLHLTVRFHDTYVLMANLLQKSTLSIFSNESQPISWKFSIVSS